MDDVSKVGHDCGIELEALELACIVACAAMLASTLVLCRLPITKRPISRVNTPNFTKRDDECMGFSLLHI